MLIDDSILFVGFPPVIDGENESLTGSRYSDYIDGGDGNDTITGDVAPVSNALNTASAKSLVMGLSTATASTQSVQNGSGNDTLDGGSGNDWISGGDGNDCLMGGIHNDTLIGGNHNDTLIGGAHNDSLVGGPGSDWFVLAPDALDVVADYTAGQQDKLVLSKSAFGLSTGAGRAINSSELATVSSDALARIYSGSAVIIYSQQSQQLFYDRQAFARIDNSISGVSPSDFWVVA